MAKYFSYISGRNPWNSLVWKLIEMLPLACLCVHVKNLRHGIEF
jgi:hypothetical protein